MNQSDTDHPQPSAPGTPPGREDDDETPRPTNQPETTIDFHLSTFFDFTWTYDRNVFLFDPDGTVVPPEKYAPEPYPRHLDQGHSIAAPMASYGALVSQDPKWWKNVAITEHDDAEFEAIQAWKAARLREVEAQEEYMYQNYYGHPRRYANEHWEGSYGAQSQDM